MNWKLEIKEFKVDQLTSYEQKSNPCLECFQLRFDDCYGTTGPYGRCMDAWLAWRWPRSVYPSPSAVFSSWNRIWWWSYYRSVMSAWITHVKCIEGVWSGNLGYARVDWEFGSYGSICTYMKFENDFWVWLVFVLAWGF